MKTQALMMLALLLAGLFLAGTGIGWAQAPNYQGNQNNNNSQLNNGTGNTPGIARVNVAPGNYNGGGIRYVTVETPTQYQQTRVRNFFAGGGLYTGTDATVQPALASQVAQAAQVAANAPNNRRQVAVSAPRPGGRLAPLYARR